MIFWNTIFKGLGLGLPGRGQGLTSPGQPQAWLGLSGPTWPGSGVAGPAVAAPAARWPDPAWPAPGPGPAAMTWACPGLAPYPRPVCCRRQKTNIKLNVKLNISEEFEENFKSLQKY